MERLWVGFGAIFGLTMVAMAAYAAHVPQAATPAIGSAIQIQGFHALALVFTGLWARRGGVLAQLAGVAFVVGIVLFCGSIYQPIGPAWARSVHIPNAAPIGGSLLMAGWLLLGLSALRR